MIDTLVTDRTAADVTKFASFAQMRWDDMNDEEKAIFLSGRGAYSFVDMNRVGEAINYLVARLAEAGTTARVVGKTDYNSSVNVSNSVALEYLSTVQAARDMFAAYSTTPAVPADMENFSYSEANDIEKILLDIDELITKSQQMLNYCGDVYAGEV